MTHAELLIMAMLFWIIGNQEKDTFIAPASYMMSFAHFVVAVIVFIF